MVSDRLATLHGREQNKKTRALYLRLITQIVSGVVRVSLAYTRVAQQLQLKRVCT